MIGGHDCILKFGRHLKRTTVIEHGSSLFVALIRSRLHLRILRGVTARGAGRRPPARGLFPPTTDRDPSQPEWSGVTTVIRS